jgi:hypothetical protein
MMLEELRLDALRTKYAPRDVIGVRNCKREQGPCLQPLSGLASLAIIF